jgi:hypothetical protein
MTIDRQIACVKKEIERRKRIFPYLIESEKLTQDEADLELEMMKKVRQTLTQLKGILTT